jgi:alginate O-acetyltransferase complex protein AlgJ
MTLDPHAREREAHAEIERTRGALASLRALVGAGLALLVVGVGLEAAALARGDSRLVAPLPAESVGTPRFGAAGRQVARTIQLARELEHRFDEGSALARAIRPHGQRALTGALGYGNEEALAGRAGWLHFRADFDHLTRARPTAGFAGDPVAEIVAWQGALAARGIALVVLPAPVKLAIEPATFAGGLAGEAPLQPPAEAAGLAALAEAGVVVFEPAERLAALARTSGAAYLERDTHWRPEALDAVARALAVELRGVADLPPGDPARFVESVVPVAGRGDLTALLGLPEGGEPPPQTVEIRPVTHQDGSPWRPAPGAPLLLLGDSFSAVFALADLGWGAGAGLAERLSFHLGLPVDRRVRNAGGASASRALLAADLARDAAALDGVKVVVWQFAARELSGGDWRRIELP